MDAYSSYIMRISDMRASELRKEAADYALSGAARRRRRARWADVARRLVRARMPAPAPLPLPQPAAPQAFSSSRPSSR